MNTEEGELVCVWNGTIGHDVYLGALKGLAPFPGRDVGPEAIAKTAGHARPVGDLILTFLTDRGPMTQSQLASACNRAANETRKVMRRLAHRGAIALVQPSLFAMDPVDGQLWRRT